MLRLSSVASVTVTNGGSGYPAAPTVTFSAPAGGTRATGTAKLAESGNDQYQNLYWARQTLDGKQLLVRLADQARAVGKRAAGRRQRPDGQGR